MYEMDLEKYVPIYRITEERRNDWFNRRYEAAKQKRDYAWDKIRRSSPKNGRDYKVERDEYLWIGREEQKFKKDIIDKYGEKPKLFHRHINKKLKQKKGIVQLRGENRVYEERSRYL